MKNFKLILVMCSLCLSTSFLYSQGFLKASGKNIVNDKGENVLLRGIVMSKRREVIGRPLIYGVQFKFDSKSNKKRYVNLERLWKKQKNNKRKMKFAHV